MRKNKIIALCLTFLIMFSVISLPTIQVNAKNVNVTSSMKKNKGLKKLAKRMAVYCVGDSLGKSKGEKVNIKNNNKNRLSVSAFVRYHFDKDFAFTKREMKKTVKELFGKKVKKLTPYGYFAESYSDYYDSDFIYGGGDFGNMIPMHKIKKITKSNNSYTVKILGKIKGNDYDDMGNPLVTKQCMISLKVKKQKNTKYGFVTTGMKYKVL